MVLFCYKFFLAQSDVGIIVVTNKNLEILMERLIIFMDEQVIHMKDLPQYVIKSFNAEIMLKENGFDLNEEVLSWYKNGKRI